MRFQPQRALHGDALAQTAVAAAATAFLFAAVNVYWGLGGTAGLSTLGGTVDELARSGDPTLMALNWLSAVLKAAAGLMALALLRRRDDLRQRFLLAGTAVASVVLIGYGLLQTVSVALIATDVVTPARPPDEVAIRWRLLLWEPWFLVWGALLGAATRLRTRYASDAGTTQTSPSQTSACAAPTSVSSSLVGEASSARSLMPPSPRPPCRAPRRRPLSPARPTRRTSSGRRRTARR